ncbi:MAG: NAD(FAD)-utilizing dehydrogenase, partial [Firmicutes bacterium]|nr:NAD(FAD)-utilizing dehydrogenase [Bacillota bacterium]
MILAGGGEDLRYKQKPHVGTDVLRTVVTNIRKEIIRLGGEVLFETKLTGLELDETGAVEAIVAQRGTAGEAEDLRIETEVLVLALGHSARDTFAMLHEAGIYMEQKPFSIGVRIEHPQTMIDLSQYGAPAKELGLGAAEYKLNWKCTDGRGVYTF